MPSWICPPLNDEASFVPRWWRSLRGDDDKCVLGGLRLLTCSAGSALRVVVLGGMVGEPFDRPVRPGHTDHLNRASCAPPIHRSWGRLFTVASGAPSMMGVS